MVKAEEDPSGTQRRVTRIMALFRELGTLGATLDYEPSFKAVRRQLFESRFLVGVARQAWGGVRDDRILGICQHIDMPSNQLAALRERLPLANHVYFGAERDQQSLLLKVYLEFRDRAEKLLAATGQVEAAYPLFTGWKWDAFCSTRQACTQYGWWPSLPVAAIDSRLRALVDPQRHEFLLELVGAILRRAQPQIDPGAIQFLEVTEEGNSRKSFDINLYRVGLRMSTIRPELVSAMQHYGVWESQFHALYPAIESERFGHLAGGVDRHGDDFVTIYYGARKLHSDQFKSASIVEDQQLSDRG